jgi:putative hemolysin
LEEHLIELTIILISLFFTFYFSGTETAFITVNKVRIEVWRRQKKKVGEIITKFIKKPERFIYTTLVGNNLANIAFASFTTVYLNKYIDQKLSWLFITTLTVLWGEIIPKTFFRSLADWIILKVAYPLEFFYHFFKPIIWFVSSVSGTILKLFGQEADEIKAFFSKKDIEILLQESKDFVDLEKEHVAILDRILRLKDIQVREIMVPRTEIVAIDDRSSLEDCIQILVKSEFTKIPVFHKELDNVTGIIYLKDLFLQPLSLKEIIREVMFVPDTKQSLELLTEFRKNNTSIAVVFDEYGGTAGLVTTEDIIEELVGEIEDEFDEKNVFFRKIGKRTYSVNVRIEMDQLKSILNLDLPEGNYETFGGFILSHLGRIPKRNESFEIAGIKIIITKATKKTVKWARIILPG